MWLESKRDAEPPRVILPFKKYASPALRACAANVPSQQPAKYSKAKKAA